MQYDYLEIIKEYWRIRNAGNFRHLKLKILERKKKDVFEIINLIFENNDAETFEEKTIKSCREDFNNIDDVDYLEHLHYFFIATKVRFLNEKYDENNKNEIALSIIIITAIFVEFINVLKRIRIENENKFRIRQILGRLVLDNYFVAGYLSNDWHRNMIFNYIFWIVFCEKIERDKENFKYESDVEIFLKEENKENNIKKDDVIEDKSKIKNSKSKKINSNAKTKSKGKK